jgi:hypothetical protein
MYENTELKHVCLAIGTWMLQNNIADSIFILNRTSNFSETIFNF